MTIEELQKEIERYYEQKGIASCRFNALKKIIMFIKQTFKDDTKDISFLLKIEKEKLKLLYENQKENKKLNDAEKQAINDIYNNLIKKIKEGYILTYKTIDAPIPTNNKKDYKQGLKPWVGKNPKVLILGTMPGDESIRKQAYYADPRNSFWKIMNYLFTKERNQDNKEFITSHNIALWDCIHSGIRASSKDDGFEDGTIILNDLESFLNQYPSIKTIILNGKSKKGTVRYFRKFSHINTCHIKLYSTSNTCSKKFDDKIQEWSILKDLIENEQ